MPRTRFLNFFLLLLASSLLVVPASAQDNGGIEGDTATITMSGNVRSQVRLAFPNTETDDSVAAAMRPVAQEIDRTLRDDLEDSGVFNIQGPVALSVLTLTGDSEHDFEQFRSLGNEVVLLATVKQEADKIVLEGRVYDLASGQTIAGKRYRGLPAQARRIAHTLADELHYQFTGRPGISLTSIAFHSNRDSFQEIYLMDYDGRNQRPVSAHKSVSGYSDWSPTGDAIAYISYYSGVPGIYYADMETNSKVKIYDQGTLNISPSISPDGRRVAFAHSSGGSVDIYVCDRDDCEPKRITNSKAIDTNPVWDPSGTQIAFTSDRSGRPNIYVMHSDGSNIRRISFEGDYNDGATWRPDGTQLAYASRHGNKFRIALTSLLDLSTQMLTDADPSDSYEEPSFSPDGRRIAFTLRRGSRSQVYVMRADGSNWRQLTTEGNNSSPDWSGYPRK